MILTKIKGGKNLLSRCPNSRIIGNLLKNFFYSSYLFMGRKSLRKSNLMIMVSII